MRNKTLIKLIVLSGFLFLAISVTKVFSLSLSSEKYTIFKTENQGFKFYTIINNQAMYTRASSKDLQYSISIERLACDQNLYEDDCDKEVVNSNVGAYAYDLVRKNNLGDLSSGVIFKGYVRYRLPSDRQPASYIRDPSMDIIVTGKEFSANPWRDFPYYGDYRIYKRAPCDNYDEISYECQQLFYASSTENTLYDLQFSNPFRNNDVRRGEIGFYAQAFSTNKPTFSFSKLFSQSPQIDSNPNQVITNEVFKQLLISSLYRQDYFELLVDHNLWIEPYKEIASIAFYGSSPYRYVFGAGCPAGENNFPCKVTIDVFGFPVWGTSTESGYFFRDFIKNYFRGQVNQFIAIDISGRSADWSVRLCFDNNLKKIYSQIVKIRGADSQDYEIFSNGKIRLTVDDPAGAGDVKIRLQRKPYINRTCANLGGFQYLMDYSW